MVFKVYEDEDAGFVYFHLGRFDNKDICWNETLGCLEHRDPSDLVDLDDEISDTWAYPFSPINYAVGDMVFLKNATTVKIVGLSPILPPHSWTFSFLLQTFCGSYLQDDGCAFKIAPQSNLFCPNSQ